MSDTTVDASTLPPRGTFDRALSGYDDQHRQRLVEAIMTAIATESRCSDAKIMVMRTGEICDALILCLVGAMATSTAITPTKLRDFADQVRKRIIRGVPQFRENNEFLEFMSRTATVSPMSGHA
jgi:hypothetical protein